MVFAADWMPTKLDISREFARSLSFYCGFAVGDAPSGRETVPGTIIWGLQWLMPMTQAEAQTPGVTRLQRDYDMTNPGFPQHNSIHIRSLYGRFVDPSTRELFNICNLICDANKQLISVELVATNPKVVAPLPPLALMPKDPKLLPLFGTREPYYDFIEVKGNASTEQHVEYRISSPQPHPGVTVIQTMLINHRRGCLENVRWYLTAPFARKLLDMVNTLAPEPQKR